MTHLQFQATRTRSTAIYQAILAGVVLFFIAIPFIRVPLSAQSTGTLRPLADKTEIHPLVAGTITRLGVRENQTVHQGDTLLVLQSGAMQAQLTLNTRQQAERTAFVRDLEALVRGATPAGGLRTQLYGQQAAQLHYQQQQLRSQLNKSGRELATAQRLYESRVIARIELEDKAFAHRKLLDQARVLAET